MRFLLPIIAFLFSAAAGISVAAWLDAPNMPPNYGLTPPYTQADYRPMNLGTTPQTKNGSMAIVGTLIATSTTPTSFPNFPGSVIASSFQDAEDTAYGVDPGSASNAGVFRGFVGIRQQNPVASLAVNNGAEVSGKTGSPGDAIYAYANSTGAALSAEQGNPAGYAVYASGGINYFGGDVQVGSAASPKNLCLNGDCKAAWPSGVWTQTGNDIYNTNTGNVGIGTTTPGAKLHVAGDIQVDGTITTSASTSFSKYLQIKSGAGIYYLPLYYGAPPGSGSFCRDPASGTYCGGRVYQGTPTLQSQSGTTAYYTTGQIGTGCQCGNQQGYQFNSQYNMETQTWMSSCSLQINFQQSC